MTKLSKNKKKIFYNLIENIFNQSRESIVVPFPAFFMRVQITGKTYGTELTDITFRRVARLTHVRKKYFERSKNENETNAKNAIKTGP